MALEAAGSNPVTHPRIRLAAFRDFPIAEGRKAYPNYPVCRLITPLTPNPKILTREVLCERRAAWRQAGRQVVFTNGCFDLLHRGHVEYLREARQLGDVLVVGVNSDASVGSLKGPGHPVVPETDRVAIVAALEAVTHVVVFDEVSVAGLIEEIVPDVLVKGGDYRTCEVVGREIVEAAGGAVHTVTLWPAQSTSSLWDRIRSQTD